MVFAIGFSTYASRPARTASTPWSACWKSAVATMTASTSLRSYNSSLFRARAGRFPVSFSIYAAPSSRRRLQMSETATISKFRSTLLFRNDGINAERHRSENPTMPTRTRSLAPTTFAADIVSWAGGLQARLAAPAPAIFRKSRRDALIGSSNFETAETRT